MAADDIIALAIEYGGPEAGNRARPVLEETARALAERLQDLEAKTEDARERLAGAAAAFSQFQVCYLFPAVIKLTKINLRFRA